MCLISYAICLCSDFGSFQSSFAFSDLVRVFSITQYKLICPVNHSIWIACLSMLYKYSLLQILQNGTVYSCWRCSSWHWARVVRQSLWFRSKVNHSRLCWTKNDAACIRIYYAISFLHNRSQKRYRAHNFTNDFIRHMDVRFYSIVLRSKRLCIFFLIGNEFSNVLELWLHVCIMLLIIDLWCFWYWIFYFCIYFYTYILFIYLSYAMWSFEISLPLTQKRCRIYLFIF